MNRDKQIEEMAKIICTPTAKKGNCDKCGFKRHCSKFDDATDLYNAGYRKASEVASEVIDEIFEILDAEYRNYDTEALSDTLNKMYMSSRNTVIKITAELVELKKKYTEET